MTPRNLATQSNLNKKRKAFENKRLTSHWPHKIKLFPKKPQTYGNPLPQNLQAFPDPILTNLGRKLAGF